MATVQGPGGTVTLRDSIWNGDVRDKLSDQAMMELTNLPPLGADQAYEGWFVSDDGSRKESTGILFPDGHGAVSKGFSLSQLGVPTGENLFADFNTFVVTIEPVPDVDPGPSAEVALVHSIPAGGLLHIRHLLFSIQGNPPYTSGFHAGTPKGIAAGLREETFVALVHAGLAKASTDLADLHLHACHVVNIIEGTGDGKGENFDPTCGNPGDGFGVLGYAEDAALHPALAASVAPDDMVITENHRRVVAAASDVASWAAQARDQALLALESNDVEGARLFIRNAQDRLLKSLNSAMMAYTSAQDMGAFTFVMSQTPVTWAAQARDQALLALESNDVEGARLFIRNAQDRLLKSLNSAMMSANWTG